ncbi:hypothetical protein A4G28_07295 [Mycobacterium ostraviense]|uniref:Enoyl-CoA hydratase/isomerase family protein n=1 Tax=Mycobacterium ostraviense TaxID=2738409 RepID=A0A162D7F3_9MYCO|nr:hypothetical protein A4G28_07295 [Mycobacterium ostraviense]
MPQTGIDTLAPVAGLDVKLTDGVLSVTIDRPATLNSLTAAVLAGIADAMERAPPIRGYGWCAWAAGAAASVREPG